MATLSSIQGEMQLSLRLLGKSYDPFQVDLEWFEYELAIVGRRLPGEAPVLETRAEDPAPPTERRSIRGKINRKDFNQLLSDLDELVERSHPMRFEPYDLNFYFEWSRETRLVYLIVTWFDLALAPRRFDRRFPSAHAGFRFLTDAGTLEQFRRALEQEFAPSAQTAERRPPIRIN